MTSSAKLNSPRSLISPPEGGGAGEVLNKVLHRRFRLEVQSLTLLNIYIYISFLTEKVSLKETY